MAAKKSYNWLNNGAESFTPINSINPEFEFDEAEMMWGTNEAKSVVKNPRPSLKIPLTKKSSHIIDHHHHHNKRPVAAATSLPVNIPDWSKILGREYKDPRPDNDDEVNDEDDDDRDNRIPPHVYLARTRVASFSVHEGIGRTLKGRDLRRVRNAIWKQTGFEED